MESVLSYYPLHNNRRKKRKKEMGVYIVALNYFK